MVLWIFLIHYSSFITIVINIFKLLQERGVSKVTKLIGFRANFRSIATKLSAMWALIKD